MRRRPEEWVLPCTVVQPATVSERRCDSLGRTPLALRCRPSRKSPHRSDTQTERHMQRYAYTVNNFLRRASHDVCTAVTSGEHSGGDGSSSPTLIHCAVCACTHLTPNRSMVADAYVAARGCGWNGCAHLGCDAAAARTRRQGASE